MGKRLTVSEIERAAPRKKPWEKRFESSIVLRIQPTGKKTLYCQHGRGRRTRLGDAAVLTPEKARYKARQILNEAEDHGSPLKRDLKKSTLSGFIESIYTPWCKANRRRADKTIADLTRCFKGLSSRRLPTITTADLDEYVQERNAEGRTDATIRRELNNLQGVLRMARERGYVRESPFKGWKMPSPEDNAVTRYLTADEEARLRTAMQKRDERTRQERKSANAWRDERGYDLLPEIPADAFPDHITPMVLVSLNTGLRYGELVGLDWSAIDFGARVLTVTGATAKGKKMRHIPLNAEAEDVLARWKAQGKGAGLVFANAAGARIGTVKTAWLALVKAAKLERFRWHDLRHSFASKLVQRGVDLAVVRDLLGHGDFKLTLRYAHLGDAQKADAVARLAA